MDTDFAILILTQHFDPHVDPVVTALQERCEVFRFDTGDFPSESEIVATLSDGHWVGEMRYRTPPNRNVDLSRVRSVWYRRPSRFRFKTQMPAVQAKFAAGEALSGLGGILRSLECLWVSHPDALAQASYKPQQLIEAQRCGLAVPETLITTSPAAALAFYHQHGGNVVYKTLGTQQPIGSDGKHHMVLTTRLQPEHLPYFQRIENTPCLLQEYVEKEFELRITVIGEHVFAAALYTQELEETRVDYRADIASVRHCEYHLPPLVSAACLSLLGSYGLRFGAIDMIVTPDGEFVFLELNCNGQWLWLEAFTGMPMTAAMVELLTSASD